MNDLKQIYRNCLLQDAVSLSDDTKEKQRRDKLFQFQKTLRKCEYLFNMSRRKAHFSPLYHAFYSIYARYYNWKSIKYGFTIPLNVFGPGLSIAHYGTIVVAGNAKIGENCRIHEGVTIGATNGSTSAPHIGNNVFIGSGAKIIGNISIADNVAIGANACVIKSIEEASTTWAGVPARKISDKDSSSNLASGVQNYYK